jgi:DNA-binding NarL/FixJ family response regulator
MVDKIRIMIVDDHPLFREGLRRVLEAEDDVLVEAEVADGHEAIALAREIRPDVVLLDISLPSMNGLQVTREIKARLPDTAVINLTAYHDEEQIIHAINAGASAYYPKEVMPDKLMFAVRQVTKGQWVIDDRVLNKEELGAWLLDQYRQIAATGFIDDSRFVPLSSREMEILQYVVRGSSNKEIAHALQISQQTVKNHISSILRKLDAKDRTEAAVYALRHGWIRLADAKPEE